MILTHLFLIFKLYIYRSKREETFINNTIKVKEIRKKHYYCQKIDRLNKTGN